MRWCTNPKSTRFDFGSHAFKIHDDYVVLEFEEGRVVRGCDPRTQTSFEVQPIHSLAATAIDQTMCWQSVEPALIFETEREAAELAASRQLRCLQLVAQVTL